MATVNFNGLSDFNKNAGPMFRRDVMTLGGGALTRIFNAVADHTDEITPRGPEEDAARRMAKGGATSGHMADRWFNVVDNTVHPGGSRPLLKAGQGARRVNDAAHAKVLDGGRRRLSTGRLGGSRQAPRGISKPTLERAEAERDKHIAEAIAAAEAKAGRR